MKHSVKGINRQATESEKIFAMYTSNRRLISRKHKVKLFYSTVK